MVSSLGNGNYNVDELEIFFNNLVSIWGVVIGFGGVLLACHKRIGKWYRIVRRAMQFFDAIHVRFGDNAALAIIESIRELTRDKAIREVRLTLLEESLGAGIYVCDPVTGDCLSCNHALSELWGLDQSAFVDFGWLSAVMPEDRIAVHDRWTTCVKNKIPYECEYRIRNQRTGREFLVMTRAYPAILEDKTLICYVGTAEEVRR